jgi:hypothetical protein
MSVPIALPMPNPGTLYHVPWFRRRRNEPPPATRADIARVEHTLAFITERAMRIQSELAEINDRLERSEQGLSTYTYAVRSLSLRLVELDDKLEADARTKAQAIDEMHQHLRAFELRLPKTRQHDPDDPERPVTLEELEDVRIDARQATEEAARVARELRAELARALAELDALQARRTPAPPPPPWPLPEPGTGWPTPTDPTSSAGIAEASAAAPAGHAPAPEGNGSAGNGDHAMAGSWAARVADARSLLHDDTTEILRPDPL